MLRKNGITSLFVISLVSSFLLWAVTATARSDGNADAATLLRERLTALATDVQRRMSDPASSIDSRDLGNAALTTLLHGGDPTLAQAEIDLAFRKQDNDPNSPTYGQVPWRTGDRGITDLNAAPFFGQALAAILNGNSNRLSPNYLVALRPKIIALAQAIQRQPVSVAYTNIYLIRAVDLILLGQHLSDAGVKAQGQNALRAWVSHTKDIGISEFDSATYYAADLSALSECDRYASDAIDNMTCSVALRYFWTDIAANYMPAAHKLSGPSSREYDFVSGNGDIAYWLEGIGWDQPAQIGRANLQGAYIEDLIEHGGYRPPGSVRDLAFGQKREVVSTYDAYPGHTRWNWVAKNVSLGCAGGSYGPQDKLLVATFAGPAKSAQLNVVLQKSGAAYGIQSASLKPDHVSPTLGCIERAGAAIANVDVETRLLGPTPHGFETDVLFPQNADLAVNGVSVTLANGDVALKQGDILAVRSGGGVVALKTLRIDPVADTPTLKLTTDAKGATRGAAWLSILHIRPGETAIAGSVMRETFIMVARDDGSVNAATSELANAAPSDVLGAMDWRVSATFAQRHFELVRSSTNRGTILPGTIDGKSPQRMILGVNGRAMTSEIWRSLPY